MPATLVSSSAPRGLRAGWLGAVFVLFIGAGLRWSCNGSAVTYAIGWARGDLYDKLLALSVVLPLCALAGIAALETRALPYRRPTLVLVSATLAALIPLAIVAYIGLLGRKLSAAEPEIVAQWIRPDPLHYFSATGRIAMRLLLLAPAAATAAWGLSQRTAHAAPLTARWLVAQTAAGLTLAWSAYCDGPGFGIALLASSFLLVLSPLVRDELAPVGHRTRKVLAGAAAVWLLGLLALTWPHRGEHLRREARLLDRATMGPRNSASQTPTRNRL